MVTALISRTFLDPEVDVAIGRFVIYPEQPHFSFFDPATVDINPDSDSASPPLPKIAVTPQESFSQVLSKTKSTGLQGALSKIAQVAVQNSRQRETQINALVSRSYRLNNSDEWFEGAVARPASRRWLYRAIIERKQSVFLVVGYRTLVDASVSQTAIRKLNLETDANVPVADIFGAGVATALGGVGDISGNFSLEYGQDQGHSFVAPGEQVYAIEYRRVKLTLFARKNLDKAVLDSKPRWEVFADTRGEGDGENVDDVSVVEAQMVENQVLIDDLNSWGNLNDGKDEVYFSEGDTEA